MQEDQRLGRIEEKLDKLADAVVGLARMEERMLTIFKRIEKYEEKQDDLEGRLTNIELDEAGKNSIYRILDKSVWLVVGIAVAFFFDLFKK
jgi:uncharacterized protein Yka (UPF0111/DUF47 family)